MQLKSLPLLQTNTQICMKIRKVTMSRMVLTSVKMVTSEHNDKATKTDKHSPKNNII